MYNGLFLAGINYMFLAARYRSKHEELPAQTIYLPRPDIDIYVKGFLMLFFHI